jgi:hypothetical protein
MYAAKGNISYNKTDIFALQKLKINFNHLTIVRDSFYLIPLMIVNYQMLTLNMKELKPA